MSTDTTITLELTQAEADVVRRETNLGGIRSDELDAIYCALISAGHEYARDGLDDKYVLELTDAEAEALFARLLVTNNEDIGYELTACDILNALAEVGVGEGN